MTHRKKEATLILSPAMLLGWNVLVEEMKRRKEINVLNGFLKYAPEYISQTC